MRPLSIFHAAYSTASFANFLQVTAHFFTSARAFADLFQIVDIFSQPDLAQETWGRAAGTTPHLNRRQNGKPPIGKTGALRLSVVSRKIDQKPDNGVVLIVGQFFDSGNHEIIKKHFSYEKLVHIPVASHISEQRPDGNQLQCGERIGRLGLNADVRRGVHGRHVFYPLARLSLSPLVSVTIAAFQLEEMSNTASIAMSFLSDK